MEDLRNNTFLTFILVAVNQQRF
jgi:hypothetical protein